MLPKKHLFFSPQPSRSFSLELCSFLPEASCPNRLVFSFTLPNRHFIIAAPTQITTSEPPSNLHSIAAILQISQQKHLTQTKRYSPCRCNAKAAIIDTKRLNDVPINFPDQWALTSWGNLISHYKRSFILLKKNIIKRTSQGIIQNGDQGKVQAKL